MHAFGADFDSHSHANDDQYLKTLFSLPDDVNIKLSETYSEIWARIMNVVFQTYFKSPPSLESRTLSKFKKYRILFTFRMRLLSLSVHKDIRLHGNQLCGANRWFGKF